MICSLKHEHCGFLTGNGQLYDLEEIIVRIKSASKRLVLGKSYGLWVIKWVVEGNDTDAILFLVKQGFVAQG